MNKNKHDKSRTTGLQKNKDMSLSVLLLGIITFVELNCENLFDTRHDSLKNDTEFTPESDYHWTRTRYWRKINHIGQEIVAMGETTDLSEGKKQDTKWTLPDFVALCEVENDSVIRDLTKRSMLRKARYEYMMTDSPDKRGIDVALVYNPMTFQPVTHHSIRIKPLPGMRPTRDILYVKGRLINDDSLHIFVVHAPSRTGGEKASRPNRILVERYLAASVDSIYAQEDSARIIIAGDFNDYYDSPSLDSLYLHRVVNISREARGSYGAEGTYRFHGEWGSLDQIIVSPAIVRKKMSCEIGDRPFLLEEDTKYGGVKPRRCYLGPRYQNGYSDHLPLVARFRY